MLDLAKFIDILDLLIKLSLGILGLWLANSYRRQIKQKTADERMKSYSALWSIMEVASPTRLKEWHAGSLRGPLSNSERMELYSAFTTWYYENGNGLFLGDRSRRIYLTAKDNLICPDEAVQPAELVEILGLITLPEEKRLEERGQLSIRQLSLLRTRMRADLEVYGALYLGELQLADISFLKYCGEDWRRQPWSGRQKPLARMDNE